MLGNGIEEYNKRKQWFIEHIGVKLYRNSNGCSCPICEDTLIHGVTVNDRDHATYLHELESEYTAEGHPLRYFETQQEATEFSIQHNDNK